jgi:hypothetical protein
MVLHLAIKEANKNRIPQLSFLSISPSATAAKHDPIFQDLIKI